MALHYILRQARDISVVYDWEKSISPKDVLLNGRIWILRWRPR